MRGEATFSGYSYLASLNYKPTDDLLVYATHSRRATGPVRLYAQNLRDRSNALPGGRNSLILAVPPRSAHELGTSLAYTVLVTDTRIFVFGGGENSR